MHKNMTASIQSPARQNYLTWAALALIILLGAFLRFYQLGAASLGNDYYAAAVKSMLTSWHNFFFVAFEPGGSITVDKPPLGFWLEALSAYFLGLTGFGLAFPNALAGTLSIPMLYGMVRKQFGTLAGLTAALVLATTPVAIATERNNTIDGLLVFVLLLACLAFWQAHESGKVRYLFLGAFIIGLGFNIKMLQAYMVLPAVYALYFFGAKISIPRRLLNLAAASLLLLAVSLSWALIVDSVPAGSRPFIGSSSDNTVMELIIGHNGVKRLFGGPASEGLFAFNSTPGAESGLQTPLTGGHPPLPPNAGGAGGKGNEVGEPGIFRLFNQQLAAQTSWLLPLALIGLALALFVLGRTRALSSQHLAILLWAGWLLPELLYFSLTGGLWHTYYLIMLGPPLAALVGIAVWALGRILERQPGFAGILIGLVSGITLGVEIFILLAYPAYLLPAAAWMFVLWLAGTAALLTGRLKLRAWAVGLLTASLLVGPLLWSGLTTFNPQPEVNLPRAGSGTGQPVSTGSASELNPTDQKVLAYLLANTGPGDYLAATLDSHGASPLILASGRPVFTFGGYVGNDIVTDVKGLEQMVASQQLRFILDNNNLSQKPDILAWVKMSCRVVQVPGISLSASQLNQGPSDPRHQSFSNLYDCRG